MRTVLNFFQIDIFRKIPLTWRLLFCLLFIVPITSYAQTNNSQKKSVLPLKTIIVEHYYPYTFVNKSGKPDGFTIELMDAVLKAADLTVDIQVNTWDTAQYRLKKGEIDFLPMIT